MMDVYHWASSNKLLVPMFPRQRDHLRDLKGREHCMEPPYRKRDGEPSPPERERKDVL